jgi:hypothetical protein
MQANKDFSATFNGREYSAKKGQPVDVPPTLLKALQEQEIVTEAAKAEGKENGND